jgi:hypothetical protein
MRYPCRRDSHTVRRPPARAQSGNRANMDNAPSRPDTATRARCYRSISTSKSSLVSALAVTECRLRPFPLPRIAGRFHWLVSPSVAGRARRSSDGQVVWPPRRPQLVSMR